MKLTSSIGFMLLILTSHYEVMSQSYQYEIPSDQNDGWATASMLEHGLDTTLTVNFLQALAKEEHQLHSFSLIKNDTLVLDVYPGDFDRNEVHDLRSVTKSIRAILVGIAIDNGLISSVDDPIAKYLAIKPRRNLDARKNQITIRHLLTMSAGWDCNDWNPKSKGQEDKLYKKKDWIQEVLDLPMINDPGRVSTYCSAGAIVLAQIIEEASGMTLPEFARKYLFSPLGMENYEWSHTSKKEVISAGMRAYLRPRDLAKIGQLVSNRGYFDGRQIVSSDWIRDMLNTQTTIAGQRYGYFWWTIPFYHEGQKIMASMATGNGGQYIMLFPDLDMIACFTGGAYNSPDDKLPFAIMNKVILPSLIK